jgi:ubiquinone/menaquinone biosynthesis C-methylase UbiE
LERSSVTSFSTVTEEGAEAYDAWYRSAAGRLTDNLEKAAVFSLIRENPGRALDLSCGTGNYAAELARRGWGVVGVDRSMGMLRSAHRKSGASARAPRFVLGDATSLPIRSASIDLVTIILGLEFMEDPPPALREVRRILRPEGILVLATLAPAGLWNLWRRLKRRITRSIWRDARFLDQAKVRTLLAASGLRCAGAASAVHYLPLVPWAPPLRLWERLARQFPVGTASFRAIRCEPVSGSAQSAGSRLSGAPCSDAPGSTGWTWRGPSARGKAP